MTKEIIRNMPHTPMKPEKGTVTFRGFSVQTFTSPDQIADAGIIVSTQSIEKEFGLESAKAYAKAITARIANQDRSLVVPPNFLIDWSKI